METMLRALCCIAFLVLLACIPRRSAQDSSCLNKLSPCLNYLNGTEDPPDSCCEPLKSVIESDAECLCSLAQGAKQNKLALISMRLSNFLVDVANMLIHCLASQKGFSSEINDVRMSYFRFTWSDELSNQIGARV
ncbi:hypothetical protein JHK86_003374 [Glycine max]|nr:hypothetical protein JHK86_003374 [Glycine max]